MTTYSSEHWFCFLSPPCWLPRPSLCSCVMLSSQSSFDRQITRYFMTGRLSEGAFMWNSRSWEPNSLLPLCFSPEPTCSHTPGTAWDRPLHFLFWFFPLRRYSCVHFLLLLRTGSGRWTWKYLKCVRERLEDRTEGREQEGGPMRMFYLNQLLWLWVCNPNPLPKSVSR